MILWCLPPFQHPEAVIVNQRQLAFIVINLLMGNHLQGVRTGAKKGFLCANVVQNALKIGRTRLSCLGCLWPMSLTAICFLWFFSVCSVPQSTESIDSFFFFPMLLLLCKCTIVPHAHWKSRRHLSCRSRCRDSALQQGVRFESRCCRKSPGISLGCKIDPLHKTRENWQMDLAVGKGFWVWTYAP